ncbi:MAG: class I SAM-dependent methyltransferase [Planctomycetes bacterium]|nr:class I SAM-dependent methyltransferase [Planctomycetota bacterium]
MSSPELVRTVARSRALALPEKLARRALEGRLSDLSWGRVVLRDSLGTRSFGSSEPQATISVRDPAFYAAVALRGSVGAGESYMRGDWTCDDLVALARILVRNRAQMQGLEGGLARAGAAALRWFHARRGNTRTGSRANIAAHYDLGNEFYRLWLDETMMYSCAVFPRPGMSLHQAQLERLERICRKLDLRPGEHLLEIGTGWGGMALHAAREHGCRVTTTTISREQHAFASERIARAGLAGQVQVLCEDYRDLAGRYDKLVSIEMVEAVGERWFDTYFEKCSALLEAHGAMLLQSITIRDQYYEEALRSVDFIQRYVFPGACIPSIAALTERVARCTDMTLFGLEDIGPHYAATLRAWRENFHAHLPQVRALGFDETFVRLWEFYLCYCEGGFQERAIGDVQLLLTKPLCRRAPLA